MDGEAALEKSNRRLLCLLACKNSRVHVKAADKNHVTYVFVFDELLLGCCIAWNLFTTITDRYHAGLFFLLLKPLVLLFVAATHLSIDKGLSHSTFEVTRIKPSVRYAFIRM